MDTTEFLEKINNNSFKIYKKENLVQIFPTKNTSKDDWKNNIFNAIFLAILQKKKLHPIGLQFDHASFFVFAPYVEFGCGCVVFGTCQRAKSRKKECNLVFGKPPQ